MNNYLYNIPSDWNNFISNENYLPNPTPSLVSPKEGLQKGNLFSNLYEPYKNYRYKELVPSNKYEELLYNLLKYKFALNELNLYLDIYPNNLEYINLFKKYQLEEKRICNELEKNYGPITLDSDYLKEPWNWLNSWPWESDK